MIHSLGFLAYPSYNAVHGGLNVPPVKLFEISVVICFANDPDRHAECY